MVTGICLLKGLIVLKYLNKSLLLIILFLTNCPGPGPYHKTGMTKETCALMIMDVMRHEKERNQGDDNVSIFAYLLCIESLKHDKREDEKRDQTPWAK